MVDQNGRWYEESDYSVYPKNKLCDYDRIAIWIRCQGYKPETSMEHLIDMIFSHYLCEIEYEEAEFSINGCIQYIEASGGIKMFDYEM